MEDAKSSGGNYDPLPDGDYELKVTEAEATFSQNGKQMWKITTEILVGPHAKRKVWDRLVVTEGNPKAARMLFDKFIALGLGPEFFATNPLPEQIANVLVGRVFRASVGTTVYNGTTRNEFKRYLPPAGAGSAAPMAAPVAAAAPAPAPAPAPAVAPAPAMAPAPAYETAGAAAPPAPPF
jgi:hypothetical protein